ncbi:PrgI family protein [bacterium]|nr:PrgI family protein [bacterium]
MEYPLPQFLEIKPKIAGPLNFRQFMYLFGAGLFLVYFYFTKPLGTFVMIAIPVFAIAIIFAFVKIKGYPIPTLLFRALSFLIKTKVYIWQKGTAPVYTLPKRKKKEKKTDIITPKLAEKSRLKELSKLVEIHRR